MIWHWNTIPGAIGYRWNTTNNYGTATDMGMVTTKTETGLTCNTAYTRYVWAYGACGNSAELTMNQATSTCPLFSCGQPLTDSRDGKSYNTVLPGGSRDYTGIFDQINTHSYFWTTTDMPPGA